MFHAYMLAFRDITVTCAALKALRRRKFFSVFLLLIPLLHTKAIFQGNIYTNQCHFTNQADYFLIPQEQMNLKV